MSGSNDMSELSFDSVLQHVKQLEDQVKDLKQCYKDRIDSLEKSVISLHTALRISEVLIEFNESSIKDGDVIQFHPFSDNIGDLKLIATKGRFYEPLTRRFYTTFQEWKETLTIPGIVRKMKTPEEVHNEAVKQKEEQEQKELGFLFWKTSFETPEDVGSVGSSF